MDLQKTIDVERSLVAIEARLGPLLDEHYRDALQRVASIMAEVRHFAVCWADATESEKESRGYAQALREASIDRLVQTIRPD